MTLPFSADQDEAVRLFVSLLLRPIVCPATERDPQKTMEIRFFAPGSLVSNLDFVESIFGNAGDPYLPENDAALDVMHWTGHTGCVIVAPHLAGIKKKDVGLPHERDATERQRRDGMCWRDPDEPYNGGGAFKVACRDERGVMVTIIADNYYGYCKKEVKTQISFAANLYGLCEEEHAGGAIAFATYVLGQDFRAANAVSLKKAGFREAMRAAGTPGRSGNRKVTRSTGAIRIFCTCRKIPSSAFAKARSDGSSDGASWSTDASRRYHLRPPQRLSPANGEAIGRIGMEARRCAPARNAVSQALHRFGRRQVGNLEVDRQRDPRRARLRRRLSTRYRAGGRDPEEGFLRRFTRTAAPDAAHAPADSEPGANDGLGDSALHAFARVHGRTQRLDPQHCLTRFANSCLP